MGEIDRTNFSDLIGRIYDCALNASLWVPTLVAIRDALNGHAAMLGLVDLQRHQFLITESAGMDRFIHAQQEFLPEMNRLIEGMLDNGRSLDDPITVAHHASAEAKAQTPYLEVARSEGLVDFGGFVLMRSPTRMAAVSIVRHESVGVFSPHDIELMRLLIPHVRRAVIISDTLEVKTIREIRFRETLDVLKLGVVLAKADAGIVHANPAAETMMKRDGHLRNVSGQLRAARPEASAELRHAIATAARNEAGIGKSGVAVHLADDTARPVVAHVLPLTGGELRTRLEPEAVAAVFISTPLDETSCAAALERTFKLTPAEGRVLRSILLGRTVPEAAADNGIATTTARTHLDGIFGKTGVSRQSELIRLATALAPAAERPSPA